MSELRIPLFLLDVVLLPTMSLPLHIFEERYKKMVGECLRGSGRFGVVYYHEGGIYPVGCTAEIRKVLKRYEDGRMDIVTRGERRFHIDQVIREKEYLEARISPFEDYRSGDEVEIERLIDVGREYLQQIGSVTGDELSPTPYGEPELMSFSIISEQDFDKLDLQKLLEMTSTRKRLEHSVKLLEHLLRRLQLKRDLHRLFANPMNQNESERR
jgi:Lon protease-like protein